MTEPITISAIAYIVGQRANNVLFPDGKRRQVRLNKHDPAGASIIHGRSSHIGRGFILQFTNEKNQADWKFIGKEPGV